MMPETSKRQISSKPPRPALRATRPPAMRRVVQALERNGYSLTHVAKAIGRSRQSVSAWQEVPEEQIPLVCKLTGLPAREVRPDLARLFDK